MFKHEARLLNHLFQTNHFNVLLGLNQFSYQKLVQVLKDWQERQRLVFQCEANIVSHSDIEPMRTQGVQFIASNQSYSETIGRIQQPPGNNELQIRAQKQSQIGLLKMVKKQPIPIDKLVEIAHTISQPYYNAEAVRSSLIDLNQVIDSYASKSIEQIVIFSGLSKCKIWPKMVKSGRQLLPRLVEFYQNFLSVNKLDFKFDPVILTKKHFKILQHHQHRLNNNSPFMDALRQNQAQIIRQMLAASHPNQFNKWIEPQQPPLSGVMHITHIAAKFSSLQIIRILNELGADFEAEDGQKQTAIFYAVSRGQIQVLKCIVEECKVNLNHREYQGRNAFYLAAFEGRLDMLKYLYGKGAEIKVESKLNRTPLSKACYLGHSYVVEYLISLGVELTVSDSKGRTALHNAAWGSEGGKDGKRVGSKIIDDSPECVQILLKSGHPIDFCDHENLTPLFSAVASMGIKSARLLISKGANIRHLTKRGESLVFIACKYNHLEMLRMLIEQYKLDYYQQLNVDHYDALSAAICAVSHECFSYLLEQYVRDGLAVNLNRILSCLISNNVIRMLNRLLQWIQIFKGKIIFKVDAVQLDKSILEQYSNVITFLLAPEKLALLVNSYYSSLPSSHSSIWNFIQQTMKHFPIQIYSDASISDLLSSIFINQNSLEAYERALRDWTLNSQNELAKDSERHKDDEQTTPEEVKAVPNRKEQLIHPNETLLPVMAPESLILAFMKISFRSIEQSRLQSDIARYTFHPGLSQSMLFSILTETPTHQNSFYSRLQVRKHIIEEVIRLRMMGLIVRLIDKEKQQIIPQMAPQLLGHHSLLSKSLVPLAISHGYYDIATVLSTHHFNISQKLAYVSQNKNHASNQLQLSDSPLKHQSLNQETLHLPHYIYSQSDVSILDKLNTIPVQVYGVSEWTGWNQSPTQQNSKIQTNRKESIIIGQTLGAGGEEVKDILIGQPQWTYYMNRRQADKQRGKSQSLPPSQISSNKMVSNSSGVADMPLEYPPVPKYIVVSTAKQLEAVTAGVLASTIVGVDVEHYEGQKAQNNGSIDQTNPTQTESFVCLVQLFCYSHPTILLDCLSATLPRPIIATFLSKLMASPNIVKVFHGGDNDFRWLSEDFGLEKFHCVIDTAKLWMKLQETSKDQSVLDKTAASEDIRVTQEQPPLHSKPILAVKPTVSTPSLRQLAQQLLHYNLPKHFQRSDWRLRPLPTPMLEYAALDAEIVAQCLVRLNSIKGKGSVHRVKVQRRNHVLIEKSSKQD